MKGNFFQGIVFFWQGLNLIFKAEYRRYVLWPVLINLCLFLLIFVLLAWYLFHYLLHFTSDFPHWLTLLVGWLFWVLYGALTLIVGSFAFSLITNIIASPFYGLLAERIEKNKMGTIHPVPFSLIRILKRESLKLFSFLPWLLVFGVLFLIPPLWVILPVIIFFPVAIFVATQYIDYCPDNQGVPFKEVRALLRNHFLTVLGFGSIVSVALTIPGANLFVPPAAVAGGCLLWLQIYTGKTV